MTPYDAATLCVAYRRTRRVLDPITPSRHSTTLPQAAPLPQAATFIGEGLTLPDGNALPSDNALSKSATVEGNGPKAKPISGSSILERKCPSLATGIKEPRTVIRGSPGGSRQRTLQPQSSMIPESLQDGAAIAPQVNLFTTQSLISAPQDRGGEKESLG